MSGCVVERVHVVVSPGELPCDESKGAGLVARLGCAGEEAACQLVIMREAELEEVETGGRACRWRMRRFRRDRSLWWRGSRSELAVGVVDLSMPMGA